MPKFKLDTLLSLPIYLARQSTDSHNPFADADQTAIGLAKPDFTLKIDVALTVINAQMASEDYPTSKKALIGAFGFANTELTKQYKHTSTHEIQLLTSEAAYKLIGGQHTGLGIIQVIERANPTNYTYLSLPIRGNAHVALYLMVLPV